MVTKYVDLTKNNLLKPRKPWGNPETTSRLTLFPRLEKRFENEMTSSRHGSRSAQVVLCQINISCHQFTQNTLTDYVRFTQIVLKFKPQVLQVFNSEQFVNLTKSVAIFWVNRWQSMLIWQRITCSYQINWWIFGQSIVRYHKGWN